ncbi:MAG: glycosyltransferase family 4 protein [Bacteroidales bacterium]|nr:glycosyltransferase family 4 protein [Bacteroidales bacterium]
MGKRLKLIRVTTADISLDGLLQGQLRFLNKEYEVVGLSADTGVLKDVGKREGIRVINVPMHREISLLSDFKCLLKLIRVFNQEQPSIVHSNTPKGSLLSMVAAKISGVPNRLYTVTGLRFQGETGAKRWLLKTMERVACCFATKVIPEGQGVKNTLIAENITHKPLKIIHNGNISGIDTSFFSPDACGKTREEMRDELGLKDGDFAFIYVGRIVKDKGMNELAEVMNRMVCHANLQKPNAPKTLTPKLVLVGPFESELDPLLPNNEVFLRTSDSVRYVGYQSDVRPFFLASDALVFPSYREGFPNVVMQAGSMGLPSIVTDINGCNEIIIEGKNGRIIPPKDSNTLEMMMSWFIDHPQEVAQMASKSREMIRTRYERMEVWNALLEMYKSLDCK